MKVDTDASQGTPRIAGSPQNLEEKHETNSLPVTPEGTNLANTVTLDSWAPELWENKLSLF